MFRYTLRAKCIREGEGLLEGDRKVEVSVVRLP